MRNKMDKTVVLISDHKIMTNELGEIKNHLELVQNILNNKYENPINLYEEMKNKGVFWANIVCDVYNLILIQTDYPSAIISLPENINFYQISKLKEINDRLNKEKFIKLISYKGKAYESDSVVDTLLKAFFKDNNSKYKELRR